MKITKLYAPTAGWPGYSGHALTTRGREYIFSLGERGEPFLVVRNSSAERRCFRQCDAPAALLRAIRVATRKAAH